ncbi:hypothetical protein J3998_10550 [Thiomicrorhabdus sp. 6S2-11]|uniref:Lipoprotein n=1 Tax=Thiomicrorhabdus marina TaxID=2818442 RepID=A0ABS3Q7V4_9GAMM|nr:hypothetical protein [Thiomicrorhabdus marina]MBO1928014.1 hypothetical protein [Thiomicrorhabdus marina]
MLKKLALGALLTAPLLLIGCSSNPVGMDDEQWKKLSPQAQEELLIKQQQINAERDLIQQDADNRARELRLQAELEEQKRLQRLYKNPMQGNVVRINLLEGSKKGVKNSWKILPESFSIARSETQRVELQFRDQQTGRIEILPAYLHYREEGTGVELHLYRRDSSDQIRFISDGQWDCGSDYSQQIILNKQDKIHLKVYIEELGAKPMYCKLRKRKQYR